MKELVGKLSRGIIEYSSATLETSESEINRKITADRIFEGDFSVYAQDDRSIKGIVYSTNCAVKILNDQFCAKSTDIKYEIDARYMENGDRIEGKFIVVSNAGEAIIAYTYEVEMPKVKASIGEINDLFNFTNLVKSDYDEALRLFVSKDFREIFLYEDVKAQGLYDGLIRSMDSRQALEEFLIGINKKSRTRLSISDTTRDYDRLTESYGDVIILTKDSWGYMDITVDIQGDFITESKRRITSEDFAGNNYEYKYLIDTSRLHDGMNYAEITFTTAFQSECLKISVDNTHEHGNARTEVKQCMYQLMQLYLEFRSRRYSVDSWSEKSLALIERARGFDDNNDFLRLVQAQICLTKEKPEEAEWLLNSVAENILDDIEDNLELYCYYLYIRTLQKRDLELTNEMFGKIKSYYENGYDSWRILWILLYLDDAYENNASLKLTRIKEQYKKGCHSPLMYYEALNVLNKQPQLLRVINSFELQILMFGCRHDIIEPKLATQIAELAMLEKNFRPLMFRILTAMYRKNNDNVTLTAICSILIRGNITQQEYFKWYALGIKKEINLTRLYEYYMFSISDEDMNILPNIIYMYFVYNGNLLFHRESYLYANIITNKDRIPNVYKNYRNNMEKFAIENLSRGEMNTSLAVVYKEFLLDTLVKDEIAKNLPHILATYEVTCKTDHIERIIVIHKELLSEKAYLVRNNKAYIEMFTEDAIILTEDISGNRHFGIGDIECKKLLSDNSLLAKCHQACDDDIYFVASATEQFIKYHNSTYETIQSFRNIMDMEDFRYAYRKTIMKDIIEYYYNNYDGDELDEYLTDINKSELDTESRNKVIELMIMRGLYEQAYEAMNMYGYISLSPRRLVKFVSRYISLISDDDDELILNIASFSFRKGMYNEVTLEYLCKYYNGITKEMIELWKIAKDFAFESRELEERLIAQILFSRTHTGYLVKIFDSYEEKGPSEMIMKAYFFYISYTYFVKDKPVIDHFFQQLEKELLAEENHHDLLHDVCKVAYLKYTSENQTIDERRKELCRNMLVKLAENGYCFEFFKKYHKWFEIPGNVADRAVIEYRTVPDCNVFIHYTTSEEDGSEYETSKMEPFFGGVYTKQLILFYGEHVMYYISEENEKGTNITESKNYYLGDDVVCTDSTSYGSINDILRCMDMKDEASVKELTKNYYVNREITKNGFKIL